MRPNPKHWKESASLIALARNQLNKDFKTNTSNYEILFQKRSNKSEFMPSTIVFPGGAVDSLDSDPRWLNHFKSFGIGDDKFKKFQLPNTPIPLIFQDENNSHLRQVTLRITAIRETFEELGVLVCKRRNNETVAKNSSTSVASYITDFDIQHWQKKVHQDPSHFLTLCQSLDCYPDIWSLYLWSNWLTPIKALPRRFNAVFFITFFDDKPPVTIDGKEVADFTWSPPKKILDSFKNKEIILPTPQWYEISRLTPHNDIHQLQKFAAARSCYGCELFFPIYQPAKDGIVVVFPGDELYPKEQNLLEKTKLFEDDPTLEELKNSAKTMHRIIYHDSHTISYEIKNYTPAYSHISPATVQIPNLQHKL